MRPATALTALQIGHGGHDGGIGISEEFEVKEDNFE
jgi:hypothetical protein